MTYSAKESSAYDASPVELYHFDRNGEEHWRWTSADQPITYQLIAYEPHPISRTAITLEGRVGVDDLQISVPRDNPLVQRFVRLAPSSTINLTVHRTHRGDADGRVVWKGRVRSVRWAGSQATLLCDLINSALSQEGPRKLYQRLCPHMLYDHRCGVNPDDHSVTGTIQAINGNILTVAAAASQDNGFWVPGYLKRGDDDYRLITFHDDMNVTLFVPLENPQIGQEVTLVAGCNRSMTICVNRFQNGENHGGFRHLPMQNPFQHGVNAPLTLDIVPIGSVGPDGGAPEGETAVGTTQVAHSMSPGADQDARSITLPSGGVIIASEFSTLPSYTGGRFSWVPMTGQPNNRFDAWVSWIPGGPVIATDSGREAAWNGMLISSLPTVRWDYIGSTSAAKLQPNRTYYLNMRNTSAGASAMTFLRECRAS